MLAPDLKTLYSVFSFLMPPPIIKGISIVLDTFFIILELIGNFAPLPASIYINLFPNKDPANAVLADMSYLSCGMGLVLLIYCTEVFFPPSINI